LQTNLITNSIILDLASGIYIYQLKSGRIYLKQKDAAGEVIKSSSSGERDLFLSELELVLELEPELTSLQSLPSALPHR
jgi:hypothetical protein